MKRQVCCSFVVVVCGFASAFAGAQVKDFPSKPVRIIAPVPPGGIIDTITRPLAAKMSDVMGHSAVIDNRGGAGTNIGTEIAARAPADGYTLLSQSLALVVNPSLYSKLPFDVERDFAPVSLVAGTPYALIARTPLPAKSVKELIALAKAKPGMLSYSSGGNGSNLHVAAELFKNMTGTDIVHVPYAGGGPALLSVLSGDADVSFQALVAVISQINSGKVRGLAITGARRSPMLPSLPTVAESGVPGFEFTSWVGILAPAATPVHIVAALNGFIVKAARSPEVVDRLGTQGADIIASSPAEFRAYIKSELARWAKVVKESGMRAD
jgi:tripartite-type tricarboxylate transporter receptor subunit TctC